MQCVSELQLQHVTSQLIYLHSCLFFLSVLCTGGILDVLHAIWEKKDRLDLVLTNANKLQSSGPEIIKHIQDTLHLRVYCK